MVKRRAEGRSRRGLRGALAIGLSLAGMLGAVIQQSASASAAVAAAIVSRGSASTASYGMGSTQMLTLALPNGATVGDVVVASLGIASGTTGFQPIIAAPAGWTLSTRTPSAGGGSIAVYWHVVGAGESSFAWTTSVAVGGVAFMTAFGGVDSLSPLDTGGGNSNNNKTTSIATPSLTTASAGELLISSFFGYTSKRERNSNWNVPSGMTELGDRNDKSNVSGSVDFAIQPAAGSTGLKSSTASVSQNYAIAVLSALRPSQAVDTTAPVVSGVVVGSVTASGALVTWTTDEASDSQVEYGPSSTYGTTSTLNPTTVVSHSIALSGLNAATTYHYRVRSRDAAGNLGLSNDATIQTPATPPPSLNETFDANLIDPTKWLAVTGGSTVTAANQQLEISHPPGPWTTGSLQSVTAHDQTNRVLQLQLKRAANNGLGGTTFGETSVFLWRDPTHYAEFFIAGGSLTALINSGSGEVNLTPSWPRYSATSSQWLRFRESAGTLYWEYADGTTTPGTWTTMASASNPFAMDSVVVKMIAGANVNVVDTAILDNLALI